MRVFFLIAAVAALAAQQPPDPTSRLERARNLLIERDKRLRDYTCEQSVERRYFKLRRWHAGASACNQVASRGPEDLILEGWDRLRLDLKVSQGEEIGSWAGSQFSSRSIFDLVGEGPYQTGMLGALIADTFINGHAAYQYIGEEMEAGARLSAYSYQVPASASHSQIRTGSGWTAAAFSGAFWLDSDSLELKRIIAQSKKLPPESGACESSTTVDYQKVRVGTGDYLLPQQSSMRIVGRDGEVTQIAAQYSGCREYSGEATIHFDEALPASEAKAAAAPAALIPEGLEFSLALTEPIDTGKAAAGDVVKAKVRNAVRDRKSKQVLIPAGTAVDARIVQMQYWLHQPAHFAIFIVVEKLSVGGVSRRLYAKPDRREAPAVSDVLHGTVMYKDGSGAAATGPQPLSPLVSALTFVTDKNRYLVPVGYQSDWLTVAPPEEEKE